MIRKCSKCKSLDIIPILGDNIMYKCNECGKTMVPKETEQNINLDDFNKDKTKTKIDKKAFKKELDLARKELETKEKTMKEICSECGKKVKKVIKGKCSKCYQRIWSQTKRKPKEINQVLKDAENFNNKAKHKELVIESVKACNTCIHAEVCFLLKESGAKDTGTVVCSNHTTI